jgi:hypothetical protein
VIVTVLNQVVTSPAAREPLHQPTGERKAAQGVFGNVTVVNWKTLAGLEK